jgi:putative ABC transport system permease protein
MNDLKFAFRQLLKNPGFTAVAVLTLALGIGANTAIFSVVNGVLLRPLPYPEPDRLLMIFESNPKAGWLKFSVAPPNFVDWRAQNELLENLAAVIGANYSLTGEDKPERILGTRVSASLFKVLGVLPALGRGFTSEEDQHGRHRVAILSQGLWERRFGSKPGVVGKAITLDAESYTVVGVMPAGFQFPKRDTEVWTPIAFTPDELSNRGGHTMNVIGRLKPNVTVEQAEAEMQTVARRLEAQYPESNKGWSVRFVPLLEETVGASQRTLLVLFGAVGMVLLIACANVANLMLARAAARQKEFAIRAALGAGRIRVIRHLLTESLILAACGGALGLALAYWGIDILTVLKPANLPRVHEIKLDGWVLAFTLVLSSLTGIVFGLAPVLHASKGDLNEALKEGGRGSSAGFRGNRIRSLLVVSELALSLVLLTSAGLMIRTFLLLRQVDPGFKRDRVLSVDMSLPNAKYPSDHERVRFVEQLLKRVEVLPGIQSAATVFGVPMSGIDASISLSVEGRPPPAPGESSSAGYRQVSPNYFRTLGTPILKGRDFTERDGTNATPVVIVSEAFVRKFFSTEDPLGQRITVGDGGPNPCQIVGVARDVNRTGLDIAVDAEMYLPMLQRCWGYVELVARTVGDPLAFANTIRETVWALDKDQPLHSVRTLDQLVTNSVAQRRFAMLLLVTFAGVALVLAAVGIYGLMAYTVAQRTREIGIRMALGAQTADVLKLVIGRGMFLAGAGIAVGLPTALGLTRLMSSLLFETKPTDGVTIASVVIILAAIAVLACLVPARRAAKVDPMEALRCE